MSRNIPRSLLLILLVMLASVVIFGLIAFYSIPQTTQAQDTTPPNLRTLLENLRARQIEDGSVIAIRFVTPLTPGEPSWIIGAPSEESARYIEYVGDDYLCFAQPGRPQTLIRCTPFENIVNIDYSLVSDES